MFGVPKQLFVDNSSEFTAQHLSAAAARVTLPSLHLTFAGPHYGGHIERLIGTMMGKYICLLHDRCVMGEDLPRRFQWSLARSTHIASSRD